jgi:hypothetical protein
MTDRKPFPDSKQKPVLFAVGPRRKPGTATAQTALRKPRPAKKPQP